MFAIGISVPETPNFACSATTADVIVEAFPGLSFKPGPATLLYKIFGPTDLTNPSIEQTVIDEYGSRIDLH